MEGTLEDKIQSAFGGTFSGTGEEELLRVASKFSLQYTGNQIRIMLYLYDVALRYKGASNSERLVAYVNKYSELKQFNNSDRFVMTALESIALKRFIGENALKINVEK